MQIDHVRASRPVEQDRVAHVDCRYVRGEAVGGCTHEDSRIRGARLAAIGDQRAEEEGAREAHGGEA